MLLLVPVLAVGQSLGDVARREKERRDDNRKRGERPTLVIGDIGQIEEGEEPTPVLGTAPAQEQQAEPEQRTSNETDRAQQEMEWRRRSSEARERIKEARKRYELLGKLHLSTGAYYVDENNEPVITSVEQLQTMAREAKTELDAATEARRKLREDARRLNVPPGWVR
jgi:hypothetical protein